MTDQAKDLARTEAGKLQAAIEHANEWLKSQEPASIEAFDRAGSTYTGYKVAYVREACDLAFGPAGWRMVEDPDSIKIDQQERTDAVILSGSLEVRLPASGSFPESNEWFAKGRHSGSGVQPSGNLRDAVESARSDLFKKCAADWSIGKRAYRGELPIPPNHKSPPPRNEKAWDKYRPPVTNGPPQGSGSGGQLAGQLKDTLTRIMNAAGRNGWSWIFQDNKDVLGYESWQECKDALPKIGAEGIRTLLEKLNAIFPIGDPTAPDPAPPEADLNLDDIPF